MEMLKKTPSNNYCVCCFGLKCRCSERQESKLDYDCLGPVLNLQLFPSKGPSNYNYNNPQKTHGDKIEKEKFNENGDLPSTEKLKGRRDGSFTKAFIRSMHGYMERNIYQSQQDRSKPSQSEYKDGISKLGSSIIRKKMHYPKIASRRMQLNREKTKMRQPVVV